MKDNAIKVSYLAKEETVCPVCKTAFRKEELLSGSGRLIAGGLTEELHRLYEPSLKYGDLYPLAYLAVVCPQCWFASMNDDFSLLPEDEIGVCQSAQTKRFEEVSLIFPDVSFEKPRDLISGAASHYLVMRCYDYYTVESSPTVKQGLAALRTSWLLEEMHKKMPGMHYDWLAQLLKRKARFFYTQALKNEETGEENLSALKIFGPDTDKNYGYEGFLYIAGLLEFKYGDTSDSEQRKANIMRIKNILAKMFGLGKSSKNRPGPLLEKSRELYYNIANELQDFDD